MQRLTPKKQGIFLIWQIRKEAFQVNTIAPAIDFIG
jgi:hypothetical protein